MENQSLRKHLILGLLVAGSLIGILSGCERKEYQQVRSKLDRQQLYIGEELQWASCFGWRYFSQDESADGDKIGYFVQEGKIVEVWHDVLSEEDFFMLINSRARELTEKYPEEEVVYRINGSTEVDQFVQLDTDKEHQLYIRNKDSVYTVYGEMDSEAWQNFLEEWLFTSGLNWDGLAVMKEGGNVSDTYTGHKGAGMRSMIQCGESCMRIDRYVALFHRQEKGFYIKSIDEYDESKMDEVFLFPVEDYPKYSNGEKILAYFRAKYSDVYSLKAYLWGKRTLWNFEEKMLDNIFYEVVDSKGIHGIFPWDGEVYEMLDCGKSDGYDAVFWAKIQMGYNDYSFFSWTQDEDGSVSQFDLLTNTHFYRKDLGGGEVIRILAEKTEETSEEAGNDYYYRVRIYDEKKNELLQELQVYSIETERSPFVFEDFNADGYLDLTVIVYYAAHNTPEYHYIFSPSKREFVKLDSELDYGARVDHETRRMYFHFYFLESYGLEVTYQWKNEIDYEVVRRFLHDGVKDGVLVEISRYENGKEEILSDYIYSYEEYEERDDIWGTYYENFIWEKEVTDKSTGKKYMIRYAEGFLPEEAEKNKSIYYDERIYVYDADTYLVSVTHSEIASESESIEWEDGDGNKEQALVIHYADGGESTFYLSELIQPDYQPAG